MIYNLIYLTAIFLILLGLFTVFYLLINKFLMKKTDNEFFTVVVADDFENLHETVYSAFVQANLLNFGKKSRVIVIDDGISDEVKARCNQILGLNDAPYFCKRDEVCSFLNCGCL